MNKLKQLAAVTAIGIVAAFHGAAAAAPESQQPDPVNDQLLLDVFCDESNFIDPAKPDKVNVDGVVQCLDVTVQQEARLAWNVAKASRAAIPDPTKRSQDELIELFTYENFCAYGLAVGHVRGVNEVPGHMLMSTVNYCLDESNEMIGRYNLTALQPEYDRLRKHADYLHRLFEMN